MERERGPEQGLLASQDRGEWGKEGGGTVGRETDGHKMQRPGHRANS